MTQKRLENPPTWLTYQKLDSQRILIEYTTNHRLVESVYYEKQALETYQVITEKGLETLAYIAYLEGHTPLVTLHLNSLNPTQNG